MRRPGYPHGFNMTVSEWSRFVDRVVAAQAGDLEAAKWFWDMWAPALAADPTMLDILAAIRSATSPSATRLIWERPGRAESQGRRRPVALLLARAEPRASLSSVDDPNLDWAEP